MKAVVIAVSLLLACGTAQAKTILFVGNSFTYGANSAAHYYKSDTVTDLNGPGPTGKTVGGVYAWDSRAEAEAMYTDAWRAFVREKYRTEPVVTYLETPVVVDNVTNEVLVDA